MNSLSELPSGLVTFVFTDIEGSTLLLRRLGDAYDGVLEHHRALLREAWSEFGGREVSTSGDSCFVAFSDATSAVQACGEGQRRLQQTAWPEGDEVRVRMGVHTGLASPHGDDYVALAVHQAARVMSAGHGGQVLVSEDAAALVGKLSALRLAPIGRYRLRDFDEPVQLSTVVGDDIAPVSTAIRALPAEGNNLVRSSDAFVGRTSELADVASRLGPGCLVTLVGPGGVGKTRLATEIGFGATPAWEDGVWLVDLAIVSEPTLVTSAIADAIGVPTDSDADEIGAVLDALESRRALLVLDGCEHLIEACAAVVSVLSRRCPFLGVLATSRTPLAIAGEHVFRLGPLGLPAEGASFSEIRRAPAVQLLTDRAAARGQSLVLDPHNIDEVATLCRRLDGLPLALELAAAQLGMMAPADVVASLNDPGEVLPSRQRFRPERQRSLNHLLDWSYDRLNAPEQAMLRCIAVLGADFSAEAAASTVAGIGIGAEDSGELLWSLLDKSLIVRELRTNATRFRLLETVRAYGRAQADPEERASAALALADWLLGEIGPWTPRDRVWMGKVAAEADNIRALMVPLAEIDAERAQLLACAVGRYHDLAHSFRAGAEELMRWSRLLRNPSPARLVLHATLADLQLRLGDTDGAAREIGEADMVARSVNYLPDWDDAALERVRGELALRSGDPITAQHIAETALAGRLSTRGRARMWNVLGIAAAGAGELARSAEAFAEELALTTEMDDVVPIAASHGNLAEIAMRRGDRAGAAREQLSCLRLALELGLPVMIATSLIVSARLTAAVDQTVAVELHSSAEQILAGTGATLYDDDRVQSDEMVAAARAALGEGRFQAAAASGVGKSVDEVIEQAAVMLESIAGNP